MKFIRTIIILATIGLSVGPTAVSASGTLSPWAVDAIRYANEARHDADLPILVINDQLSKAAASKLTDMEKGKYFAHTSSSGVTPWSFIESVGYPYRYAGENLAIHYENPAEAHQAWMESEKHCRNILDPRFHEIGMAVKKVFFEGRETILVVTMFGTAIGDETETSKDRAIALCQPFTPLVSGDSESRGEVSGLVAALKSLGIPENRIAVGEVAALAVLSLVELVAVSVVVGSIFRREWREGVIV